MTPNCRSCRWYYSNEIGSCCRHPDAAKSDRVHGTSYPVLTHIIHTMAGGDAPPNRKATLDACDREGRFEETRPWWKFW